MDEIKKKLDNISEDIVDIKIILAKQEANLEKHIERSNRLENLFDLLQSEFKQIQKRHLMFDGIIKFIGFLGVIASILKAISML